MFGARARVLRPPRSPATSGGGASTETAVPLPFTATQPVEAMFDFMFAELPHDLAAQRAEALAWEKR